MPDKQYDISKLVEAAEAALAYDTVVRIVASNPEMITQYSTAEGKDLDDLYDEWMRKTRDALGVDFMEPFYVNDPGYYTATNAFGFFQRLSDEERSELLGMISTWSAANPQAVSGLTADESKVHSWAGWDSPAYLMLKAVQEKMDSSLREALEGDDKFLRERIELLVRIDDFRKKIGHEMLYGKSESAKVATGWEAYLQGFCS